MGSDNSSTACGWRVLAIDIQGPCNEGSIIPFFEYIIGINGKRLDGVAVTLKEELQANCNKPTELTILNYKTLKTRKITVCPSDDWGGIGLLGLIITYDNFRSADERVVRVLSVYPDSPAMQAGLHPFVDYILGTDKCIFHGIDSFDEYISNNVDVELTLRVYNSKMCQVREVKIRPTSQWGNATSQGILGCEVSSGLLHKVPDVPGETCITVRDSIATEETVSSNLKVNCGEAGDNLTEKLTSENNNASPPPQPPSSEAVETPIPSTECAEVGPSVGEKASQILASADAEQQSSDKLPLKVDGETGPAKEVGDETVTAETAVKVEE